MLPVAAAVTARPFALSKDVDEQTCSAKKPADAFDVVDRQVFLSFIARGIKAGDHLRIEWVNPSSTIADTADYPDLPATPSLCFISQLPVSGFPASVQPGTWRARVVVNEVVIVDQSFQIRPDPNPSRVRVASVSRITAGPKETELVLDGAGFEGGSVAHVAEYTKSGGWSYIRSTLPATVSPLRITIKVPALGPGEYLAIVRNPDDALSQPARFLISTASGYQLPFVRDEKWLITQTPYGGFSHWGRSLHAFDIAPRDGGKWIAAMRPGTVIAHDVGARQDHTRRTFGNYITIQHEDGEFSHYAHLTTKSFLVKTGDHVEAGQPLAKVGNSGYTLGEGGGYHVHVHVTKDLPASSPSIPFKFTELKEFAVTALKNREITGTAVPGASVAMATVPALAGGSKVFEGSVPVAGRWTDILPVVERTKTLEVALQWQGKDRDLDLQLLSPQGQPYQATAGVNEAKLQLPAPEPGTWRLMVAGMKGSGEAIEFRVLAAAQVEEPPPVVKKTRKRVALVKSKSLHTN